MWAFAHQEKIWKIHQMQTCSRNNWSDWSVSESRKIIKKYIVYLQWSKLYVEELWTEKPNENEQICSVCLYREKWL